MKTFASFVLVCLASLTCAQTSFAQALRNGLGDASSIVTPYRAFESTGNPNAIGDFSNSSLDQDTGAFATRHLRTGNSSGIGGSFLGTTNVTAESSPARIGRTPITAVRALIPTQSQQDADGTMQSFSQRMMRPVSTALTPISPSISRLGNASIPALESPTSSLTLPLDAFYGPQHRHKLDSYLEEFGAPSFDKFH